MPSRLKEALIELEDEYNQLFRKLSQSVAGVSFEARQLIRGHHGDEVPVEAENEKVIQLNERLRSLQDFLAEVSLNGERVLKKLMRASGKSVHPFYDYEIEAEISYCLDEVSPEFSENDDNILGVRYEPLKYPKDLARRYMLDHTDRNEEFGFLNDHTWLLNDLYDHGYGPNSHVLSKADCADIGTIDIDVVIRLNYSFGVESGEWRRRSV